MRFLYPTAVQRRVILFVSVVAVLVFAPVNHLVETSLGAEIEVLFLIPISAVAWTHRRVASLLFAVVVSLAATISCVIDAGFPPVQTAVELVMHTGTFLSAALVVNMLAKSMRRQTRRAQIDALTESVNPEPFHEYTEREIARGRRYSRPLTVAFLDLDDFKKINDEHGHLVGDEALRCVAGLIRGQVRDSDIVGRLGGDEFGILLPEIGEADARLVLERIRERIAECAVQHQWPISASIGAVVVSGRSIDVTADSILKRADAAMYRVKASGKNGLLITTFE